MGFTEQDIAEMLDYYDISASDSDRITGLMKEWYDNYRFSDRAENTVEGAHKLQINYNINIL
ncbi:AAA family ATPase [Desulfococcaceae bacterium HSG8]|nr:AAA family ATPase [Desulfococcaceae bacterium HSG8]